MKIERIKINGFGRFVDMEISFGKGFNVVFGENEAGKSTLQAFIKAMLFGFPNQHTDGEGRMPESKKYEPWSGADYSGTMEILTGDGRFFKIERDFAKNECRVFDRNLHDVSSGFPYKRLEGLQVGEGILGMDRECFESSAFISQGGSVVLKDRRSGLFERLMNLALTGNENTSAVDAVVSLKRAATELGNNRTKNRPYNRILSGYEKYKDLLSGYELKSREMLEHKNRLAHLENEMDNLSNRLERQKKMDALRPLLEEKDALRETVAKYEKKSEKIEELNNGILEIRNNIDKKSPGPEITEDAVMSHIRTAARGAERMKTISGEDPDVTYRRISDYAKRRKLLSSSAYASIALSVAAAIIFHPAIFGLTALFTIFLVAVLLAKPPCTEEDALEKMAVKRECSENLVVINAFIKSAGFDPVKNFTEAESTLNEIYRILDSIEKMNRDLSILESRKSEMEATLDETLGGYHEIGELRLRMEEIDDVIQNSEFSVQDISRASDGSVAAEYNDKRAEAEGIRRLLNEYLQSEDELAETAGRLQFYEETLESIEYEKQCLSLAEDAMEEAAERLKSQIVPEINKNMSGVLNEITGGKYGNLATGPDAGMNAQAGESVRSVWEFSDGTIDQMYFALRVAVLEIFAENEKSPVLFDEIFAYYDENRIKNALVFLLDLSRETQVFLFTCKQRELDLIPDSDNVEIIRI